MAEICIYKIYLKSYVNIIHMKFLRGKYTRYHVLTSADMIITGDD